MNNLKELRTKNRLSIKDLASKLGVSSKTVSNWEKGESIKANHLVRIAQIFAVSVDDILGIRK